MYFRSELTFISFLAQRFNLRICRLISLRPDCCSVTVVLLLQQIIAYENVVAVLLIEGMDLCLDPTTITLISPSSSASV